MLCPNCGFDNPEGMNFCGQCAAPLKLICPDCGSLNPVSNHFCSECGALLSPEQIPSPSDNRHNEASPDSFLQLKPMRCQLTVMFCDLVGSTALSEQLDPEELWNVVRAYQEACAKAIARFDGYIAQYLGDGILVYFGYPVAHEHDAQRAVRAALGIIAAVKELNTQNVMTDRDIELAVRLGIHTGQVVVGQVGAGNKHEQLAIGETPNIAARLQGRAAENSSVIGAATHRLLQGLFDCQSLGVHTLKGISEPMEIYRVIQESEYQDPLEVEAIGLTNYIGRDRELEQLSDSWEQAKLGKGLVVLTVGEAGLGKSRLVRTFKERLPKNSYKLLQLYGSSLYQNSPLYPAISMLRVQLDLSHDDSADRQLAKLEHFLSGYNLDLAEAVPLFASVLSISLSDRYTPINLSFQNRTQRLSELLSLIIREMANRQPVLAIAEDLHWSDDCTLELLRALSDRIQQSRVLLVCTSRPGFSSPWSSDDGTSTILLNHLSQKETELLIENVAGGKRLPDEMVYLLAAKTDGVPLFVEEMTKMILESGLLAEREEAYVLTSPLQTLPIPPTLQSWLMARLDRLKEGLDVAQLGATLGREFSYELIKSVSPLEEETLQKGLAKLVDAGLLFATGKIPNTKYQFKHALIKKAAHESLLKATREQYRQKIALVLEE